MASQSQPRRVLRTVVVTLVLAALIVLVGNLAFEFHLNQERARLLDGVTPGMPFQQADAALLARARAATAEESGAFAFEERQPQGLYAHYWSGMVMIRVDQKDGVVESIEAEKVEFK